jgi:hypothetical protein
VYFPSIDRAGEDFPGRARRENLETLFMKPLILSLLAFVFLQPTASEAIVVNVAAAVSGCTPCNGAHPQPGDVIGSVIAPTQVTLEAGSYTVTNGDGLPGADPSFTAWSGSSSGAGWIWDFLIIDHATNEVVLDSCCGTQVYPTQLGAATSLHATKFSKTFRLTHRTTLDFVVEDPFPTDNLGGVALVVESATAACGAPGGSALSGYDLREDWSELANPNGVWSYREGINALPHVSAWQGLSGDFGSAQPAWARFATGTSNLPPWFKSSAIVNVAHDWRAGDVVVHSTDFFNGLGSGAANVAWTSPVSGCATVTGGIWMGRDIGRANHWALFDDGLLLTEGDIQSGDAYGSSVPFHFASGSGGALALSAIPVSIGEVLELRVTQTSPAGTGDYAVVDLQVSTVPEPSSGLMTLVGFTAIVCARRRKGLCGGHRISELPTRPRV